MSYTNLEEIPVASADVMNIIIRDDNISIALVEVELVKVISRKRVMRNLLNKYDYILIDCMRSLEMITIFTKD